MLIAVPDPERAFTDMYRREFPYVWKTLWRLGARSADREDLAHDVFATAYRHWDRYDPARPVRPWLFGIAYRVVLDFKRKRSNRGAEALDALNLPDGARNAEDRLGDQQGLRLAAEALGALELDRRAVFIMHEIDERPIPEVAEALGIPINTAYSRLRLARRDFNDRASALQLGRVAS
jgi:RNA polymerase sigma-70 factor (ECF subfamily)